MKIYRVVLFVIAIAGGFFSSAIAVDNPIPVTVDNFIRAETDHYFTSSVKEGAFGKFRHKREPVSIDDQFVIRMNRDTLYSSALFDLDAGPVTITMPNSGQRFMSLMIVDEDHYIHKVAYGVGTYVLDKHEIGTRYAIAVVRTFVDPANPSDVKKVHALQNKIQAKQAGVGKFEVPNWDPVSLKKVRDALLVLASTIKGFKNAFGSKEEVDPVKHLIATAAGWGGNPEKDATYIGVNPSQNNGQTVYKLTVKDVPVDAFWSITVYNAQGYMEKNPYAAYSLNSVTAKKSADGTAHIRFGACDGKIPNCLPITDGWNYLVRLYRPREEILNGTWKFPEATPDTSH